MDNTELLRALGFRPREQGPGWTLTLNRGDGKRLGTVYVNPDKLWDACIVYWARSDDRGATDDYITADSFQKFLEQFILWGIKRGRTDMKAEVLKALDAHRWKLDRLSETPTPETLKSKRERDEEGMASEKA